MRYCHLRVVLSFWLLVYLFCVVLCVFFFKQKTAYEMRISDWSSDVCSSDLGFRPWLYLARAHWSDSAAAAARDVAIARDEFAAMGAFAHAARLADTAMSA